MQACTHQPSGYEHVILHKLFGRVGSQQAKRVMADEEVEGSINYVGVCSPSSSVIFSPNLAYCCSSVSLSRCHLYCSLCSQRHIFHCLYLTHHH